MFIQVYVLLNFLKVHLSISKTVIKRERQSRDTTETGRERFHLLLCNRNSNNIQGWIERGEGQLGRGRGCPCTRVDLHCFPTDGGRELIQTGTAGAKPASKSDADVAGESSTHTVSQRQPLNIS